MSKLLPRSFLGVAILTLLLSACAKNGNAMALVSNNADKNAIKITANSAETVNKVSTIAKNDAVVWDYRGLPITFAETPKRVVVISSVLVGVLDEMGVEVTGANTIDKNVKSSLKYNKNISDIGSAVSPDMGILKSLKPDIVIMGSAFGKFSADITEAGIPLWIVDNQTYGQMMNVIDMFGNAFEKREKADELLNNFDTRKNEVLTQINDKKKPSVLVLWGTDDQLMVARDKSFVCDVLKILGCRNVANDVELKPEVPNFMYVMDEKKISQLNPDVIIRIYDGDPEKTKVHFDNNDEQLSTGTWSNMNAAKNGKVFTLPQAGFAANPGVSMMDSFEEIASIVFDIKIDTQKTPLELSQGIEKLDKEMQQIFSSLYMNLKKTPKIAFAASTSDRTQTMRVWGDVKIEHNKELRG